jgi:uncharacterized protein (TIGR01244 family)
MLRELDDKTLISGQIDLADIPGFKQAGVTMIVNNRPDGEDSEQPRSAEVEAAARAAGLEYRHIPIVRGMGPSDVDEMRRAIAEVGDGKMLAFCRSGNRSALTWAVARRGQGASIEEIQRAVTGAGYDLSPVEHLL